MKTLVVFSHPRQDKSKVNKAWLEELSKHDVTLHNLDVVYGDKPFDHEHEKALLEAHDRIVFQFPFYWYSVPAFFKKWMDDILEPGWAFGPGGEALKGKELVIATTIGGPELSYQAGNYNNFTLSEFLKPLHQTANLTQMNFLSPFKVFESVVLTEEQIQASAKDYVTHILDPELDPAIVYAKYLKELEAGYEGLKE